MMWRIRVLYEFLCRLLDYMPVLWRDRDYDFHHMYTLLYFKLIRMYDNMIHSHVDWNADDSALRALALAIKLAKRITSMDYNGHAMRHVEAKWGPLEMDLHSISGSNYSLTRFKRAKAITPEQQEQERAESLAAYKVADYREARDKRLFFAILHRYSDSWWN